MQNNSLNISALILTLNEEEMIEAALQQLNFVDEIIVLDQGSRDKTQTIAKKFTDKVFVAHQGSFDENRNLLATKAHGKWLLYVDADERLSPAVVGEIKQAISDDSYSAFYIPRQNIILGKWAKHGGWWPDFVPRLFKADKLIRWEGKIHESPKIEGKFGCLKNPIEHLTARSLSAMLKKSIKWAKIEAQLYFENSSPKVSPIKVIKFSFCEFFNRYILKLGFLDGQVGLIASAYQALHNAMILTYLWEMQNNTEQKYFDASFK